MSGGEEAFKSENGGRREGRPSKHPESVETDSNVKSEIEVWFEAKLDAE